ncbi:MAG: hypothetical protein ABR992_04070 [Solirubrobacteraceae bacterium]|jgi:hypothetical protein
MIRSLNELREDDGMSKAELARRVGRREFVGCHNGVGRHLLRDG